MLGEDWRYRQSQFHEPFRKLRLLGSYFELPVEVRNLADQKFELLKLDPKHPSLHFKKVGRFWSVRVVIHYRAVATDEGSDMRWHWIGTHREYEQKTR